MATVQALQLASDRHVAQRRSILDQLIRLLLGLWSGFDRWDDADVVAGMAARSAMLVNSAVAKSRRMQRVYLASVLRDFDVTAALPAVVDSYPRANAFPAEVYQRPVEQYIWRRRNGGTLAESDEAFKERLRTIAEADVRAAEREEAQRIAEAVPEIIGHRRIIHPELAESGLSCGLCVVAATQFYKTGDLLPIHDGCHCDEAPITKASDPGLSLNKDDLKQIYAAAGSSAAEDLKNTRVRVVNHGELGPILVREGDKFKTPEEAGRPPWTPSTPETRRAKLNDEIAELTAHLESAQQRYDDMTTQDPSTVGHGPALDLFSAMRYMRELVAFDQQLLTRE